MANDTKSTTSIVLQSVLAILGALICVMAGMILADTKTTKQSVERIARGLKQLEIKMVEEIGEIRVQFAMLPPEEHDMEHDAIDERDRTLETRVWQLEDERGVTR